jgi:uncharacterized protein
VFLRVLDNLASSPPRYVLALECAALFVAVPLGLFFHATRWDVHLALWLAAAYALFVLRKAPKFSWRRLWVGKGWLPAQRKAAVIRFVLLTAAVILLARVIAPSRLFGFPMQRPWFWLLVMVLYPILSVVPQEFLLRSFFFRRYAPLFHNPWAMIAASAFAFGFIHIVFHNPIAPLLSFIAGLIVARSYTQHRSLKWAAAEHAAYGCMVFTAGLGFYFLVGGIRL